MRIATRVSAMAASALLLAAVAALLLALAPKPPPASPAAAKAESSTTSAGWMPCLYHVMIIHDVHWAAACMKNAPPDNSADCTLPNELAAVLNKAQQESENFCARQGA